MEKKKRGRPPTGNRVRDTSVKFYLIKEDAEFFAQFAEDLGFKSHAEFWTAIAERLRSGGLAPVTWLKLGYQIANRSHVTKTSKGAGFVNPLQRLEPLPVEDKPPRSDALPRPTPALPEEQLTTRETNQLLAGVRKQLNAQ